MRPGCAEVLRWLLLVQAVAQAAGKCWCHVPKLRSAVRGDKATGLVAMAGGKGELGACRDPLCLPGVSLCHRWPSLQRQGLRSRLTGVRLQCHVL